MGFPLTRPAWAKAAIAVTGFFRAEAHLTRYSVRSATIGSTREARRAGRQPATTVEMSLRLHALLVDIPSGTTALRETADFRRFSVVTEGQWLHEAVARIVYYVAPTSDDVLRHVTLAAMASSRCVQI